MIEETVAAVTDALKAVPLRVGDGTTTGLERPCCAVNLLPGRPFRNDLDGAQHGRHADIPIVIVAADPRGIRWVRQRIEGALIDTRFTIAGRVCAPATRIASTAAFPDNDLTPAAWSATDTYRITSVAAKESA